MLLILFFFTIQNGQANGSIRYFDKKVHDLNNIEFYITNYGKIGDCCFWPKFSGQNYIYGAGIWFGAIDTITKDTMVTVGYGPYGGESEFAPGLNNQP